MRQPKPEKAKPTIRFSAKLSGNFLNLPASASAKLPKEGKVTVEGVVDSFPFHAAVIEADGTGGHRLKVAEAMRGAIDTESGEPIEVEITRVGDEPETRVPADFQKALLATPKAKTLWEDITPLARRDWIFWILTAKKSETRAIRIKKACSKLSSGMRRVCCFAGINWIMKNG